MHQDLGQHTAALFLLSVLPSFIAACLQSDFMTARVTNPRTDGRTQPTIFLLPSPERRCKVSSLGEGGELDSNSDGGDGGWGWGGTGIGRSDSEKSGRTREAELAISQKCRPKKSGRNIDKAIDNFISFTGRSIFGVVLP